MGVSAGNHLGKLCNRKHNYRNTGMSLRNSANKCIQCVKFRSILWMKKNKQKYIEWQKGHYQQNKCSMNARNKKWVENNREKMNKIRKRSYTKNKDSILEKGWIRNKEMSSDLTDFYIKSQLTKRCNLERADIPLLLVQAKRWHLKIYRLIKERS